MSEASNEIDELDTVLNTIESIDPELSVKVTRFVTNELYDPDEPETWTLSLQYARWAMSKAEVAQRDEITHRCDVCWKDTQWILIRQDGSFRPCDKCAASRVSKWQEDFVDSDGPPR